MGDAFAFEVEGGENVTDHWLTPPALLQATGPFDLDPCAYEKQPWRTAVKMYSLPAQDGLLLPWEGTVFCNPPYGPEVEKWARRLALHERRAAARIRAHRDELLPARVDLCHGNPVFLFADSVLPA